MKTLFIILGISGVVGSALLVANMNLTDRTIDAAPNALEITNADADLQQVNDPNTDTNPPNSRSSALSAENARFLNAVSAPPGAAKSLGIAHRVTAVPEGLPPLDETVEVEKSDNASRATLIDSRLGSLK